MNKHPCPNCGSDLKGEPIPDKYFVHHLESDPTWDRSDHMSHEKQIEMWGRCHCLPYGDLPPEERFGSRVMGFEIRGVYDGILYWGCPDYKWPRFSAEDDWQLNLKAVQIIQRNQRAGGAIADGF